MSVISEAYPTDLGEVSESSRDDQYYHVVFTEAENPLLAQEAWRIHAEGYKAMGFVHPEAITEEGWLPEAIDKSRGENVEYYIGLKPEDPSDCATMRKVSMFTDGSYEDLPSYRLSKDHLYPLGSAFLDSLQDPERRVKDVSGLARTEVASPMSVHEVIRNGIHNALGKDEVWIFSIVSTTFDSLEKSWGERNFLVLGKDIPLDDPLVCEGVTLRPAVLFPDRFIDNVLDAYQGTQTVPSQRRYLKTFMFFTDGLRADQMSPAAFNFRQKVLSQRQGER